VPHVLDTLPKALAAFVVMIIAAGAMVAWIV
jgi:hypothetical protein